MVGDFESQQRFQKLYRYIADKAGQLQEDETLDFLGATLDTDVHAVTLAETDTNALAQRRRYLASLLLQLLYGQKTALVHAHLWHIGAARTKHSITWTGGPLVTSLMQSAEFGYYSGHKHTVRELEFILWCGGQHPFTGRLCDVPDRIRFAGSMLTWSQFAASTSAQRLTLARLVYDSFGDKAVRGLEDVVHRRLYTPKHIERTLESFLLIAKNANLQIQEHKQLYLCDGLTYYGHTVVNPAFTPTIIYNSESHDTPETEAYYFRMRDHEPGLTLDDLYDKYGTYSDTRKLHGTIPYPGWIPDMHEDFDGYLNAIAPVERDPLVLADTILGRSVKDLLESKIQPRILKAIASKLGLEAGDAARIIAARTKDGHLQPEIPGYK